MVSDATEGVREALAKERVTATSASIRPRRACTSASLLTVMGAGAAAALRPHADRPRRRRHRDDRRSERQVAGAHAAVGRTDRRSTSPACARSSSASSTSTPRRTPRGSSTTPTGSAPIDLLDVPARRRQALHRELHAAEGVGEPAPRERRRHFVHRVQLPAAAGVRLPAPVRSRAGCTLQMGGSDQWGNITAGMRSDSQGARQEGARPGAGRCEDGGRHQVRQDGSRHGVARSGAHQRARFLPVLAATPTIATSSST